MLRNRYGIKQAERWHRVEPGDDVIIHSECALNVSCYLTVSAGAL